MGLICPSSGDKSPAFPPQRAPRRSEPPAPARAPGRSAASDGSLSTATQSLRQRINVQRINEEGCVAGHFRQARRVGADHRRAARHGLEHRQAKALELAGEGQRLRAGIDRGQIGVRTKPGKITACFAGDPSNRAKEVALQPAALAHDHRRRSAPRHGADRMRPDAAQILARLDGADEQKVAVRQAVAGADRGHGFRRLRAERGSAAS